jgi:SHS2 domain-containing protein
MTSGYELLDHTADAGLRAWGVTPALAFTEATRGMFAIVLGSDPRELAEAARQEQRPLTVMGVTESGSDWDALLVNWLAALVFGFDVIGFVPIECRFQTCEPPDCSAVIQGLFIDDPEQVAGVLIKAVTYHQLEIRVTPDRTELQVIFDI